MAVFKEYGQYDGLGLAELVRNKQVSAKELCEEAIERAQRVNDRLNAIVLPMFDIARKYVDAGLPQGPFHGVPFLLKDVHHAYKGVTMSMGSVALKDNIPDDDAEIVNRFKEAGLIAIGKTNTPEFKLAYVTEPDLFGPTRNPWNPDYSPGGSSGGSAAAVAAHIVPMASATDEGGSIRVPASYCGLFGMKPSRGRNPVGPDFNEEWDGISTSHVLTRSVRDSAALMDVVSGLEAGSPYTAPKSDRPFLQETMEDPPKLRIAYHGNELFKNTPHPECRKALENTVALLQDLGHQVEASSPDYTEEDVALNEIIIMAGHLAAKIEELSKTYKGSFDSGDIETTNRALATFGKYIRVTDFIRAKQNWRKIGYTMSQFLSTYDMLLTPVLGNPPVKVGTMEPSKADKIAMSFITSFIGKLTLNSRNVINSILGQLIQSIFEKQLPYTMIANITGLPAMSVPLHWTEESLPCGVQFIGRYGDEATLFGLAGQLERAKPWFDKRPEICASD